MSKKRSALTAAVLSLALCAASLTARTQDFRVEGAGLEADPVSYSGPCPGLITFKGKIQASGAGRVKYTYTYSDGGSGPEGFVDFDGPGVKRVETTWRLGDARTLPRFEGWAMLKVTSPNAYESNKAQFVLECKPGESQPSPPPQPPREQPQPPPGGQDDFARTYLGELPRLSAAQRQKFDAELDRLKTFSEGLQPKLAAAQKQTGFDPEAMREEFRAVAEERDEAKRAERGRAFDAKYEPRALELLRAAGIDLQAEQQRMASLLSCPWPCGQTAPPAPGNDPPRAVRLLAFYIPAPAPTPPPPSPPPAPEITEQVFRAPFTSQGTQGNSHYTRADGGTGRMDITIMSIAASSQQQLSFITQRVLVDRGVRNVRVSTDLNPVYYLTNTNGFLGYASAEAIVNLRVMEGSRQLCSDRVSLGHSITAVVGWDERTGTRPVSLQCEFTRSAADVPATYQLITELEGWAGAGGGVAATVFLNGTLQQFQVLLDRR